MSGGMLAGHKKAVIYNYPESVLAKNPKIVTFNTVNMSNALTPSSPKFQFSKLQKYGLWIGENDEAFDPIKVIKFSESIVTSRRVRSLNWLKEKIIFQLF